MDTLSDELQEQEYLGYWWLPVKDGQNPERRAGIIHFKLYNISFGRYAEFSDKQLLYTRVANPANMCKMLRRNGLGCQKVRLYVIQGWLDLFCLSNWRIARFLQSFPKTS